MIQNPIIRGFAPDPSIIRVGEDYYIATSTFEWWPGVKLYHSRDLSNWVQIRSPLQRKNQINLVGNPTSGGVWAPCLSYCDGTYYLVYTDVKTKKGLYYNNHNYLIETKDIRGVWSDPVYLNSTGFDPSLFHAPDGKKYLVNIRNGFKGILMQEYDAAAKRLVGEVHTIFKGTSIGYTEGPHLYYKDGFYYLVVAEGGTGYDHCVTFARSESLWGPYLVDPKNPMLHSLDGNPQALQKCGHADLVETQHGEWYMVHLCSRPNPELRTCILGRETAIQKIHWNSAGWPRLTTGLTTAAMEVESPKGIVPDALQMQQYETDFDADALPDWFSFPRQAPGTNINLTVRPGWLRMTGRESLNSLFDVNLAGVKQFAFKMRVETRLQFKPTCSEQAAGLAYMYDAYHFYLFIWTCNDDSEYELSLIRCDDQRYETLVRIPIPQTTLDLYLQAQTTGDGAFVQFRYAVTADEWQDVGMLQPTNILTDEHCRGFTGAHAGLYVHDMTGLQQTADFDNFLMT